MALSSHAGQKGDPDYFHRFVLVIGLMVNNLFPAKMGELARAYLIGEKENLPKTLCLSTIMVEHLLDISVLLIFLLLLMPLVSLPPWLKTSGTLVRVSAALGMIVLHLSGDAPGREIFRTGSSRWFRYLPERFRDKIQAILKNMLQGMRVVTGRYIFYAFGTLVAMWMHRVPGCLSGDGCLRPFFAVLCPRHGDRLRRLREDHPLLSRRHRDLLHYLIIVVLMAFRSQ